MPRRCATGARGEIPFSIDPSTGHRRIDARNLEALGYDLRALSRRQTQRRRTGFHASLTAEVEGVLDDETAQVIAGHVAALLADRDAALARASQRLGETPRRSARTGGCPFLAAAARPRETEVDLRHLRACRLSE
jgi:hypothetical protein